MKKQLLISLFLVALLAACTSSETKESGNSNEKFYSKVNPLIGTGGHGHTYPGVSAPFGAVQLSPDTRLTGWDGCGGYHYSDSIIYGFSHTHLSGTGVSDYGDILLMPFTGTAFFDNGAKTLPDSGYGSRFSHESELAEAGWYKVRLSDYSIDVELTSTERCGFHKYRFNQPEDAQLIIDLAHRDKLLASSLEIVGENVIRGKRISDAWAREQHVYFHMEIKEGFENATFNEDSTKVIVKLRTSGEVLVKTGISAVSIEGARKNLKVEITDWEFEKIKKQTQEKWNMELSKITVKMPSEEEEEIFYTALYHSFLNPNLFQDVDGQYRGTDLKIHQANDFTNYTIFSLWDTYRATHPLFTITQRERTKNFIRTFLNQYKNGGKLPVWELAGNYTGCMIGYHSIPVIVDAYQKGITDFDTDLALEAMIKTSTENELGKVPYAKKGYMAADEEHESVSKNLEYAYDDWCIAQFAKALGKDDIYKTYLIRAQSYKNIFDPQTGFMRSKRNQQFQEPFDPTEVNFNFTEANSWQYSFYVPQDVSGLIELQGGTEAFDRKLDGLFAATNKTTGRTQVDITGLIGQYAHGNEPSHHMAYLYNYVGKPEKTQKMIRRILDEMYAAQPDGLIGNEDCGQMSSWYVLSSLGFYPVTPGSEVYVIGSPNILSAKINLENGKTFVVEVVNQSETNVYIQSIQLNGKDYKRSYLTHQDIMEGGELIFTMGPQPNTSWFTEHPVSSIEEFEITPVPFITAENQVFTDELVLELGNADPNAKIYYTLDGSEPDARSTWYQNPIRLNKTTRVHVIAVSPGKGVSKPVKSEFFKIDNLRKVIYNSPYDPQYSAGGDKGLVDYIRGGSDFRTGAWQGWQGMDVKLIVDLGRKQKVNEIRCGFIQDVGSWILMPKKVHFFTSEDGKNYELAGSASSGILDKEYGSLLDELGVKVNRTGVRYIKIVAETYGTLPEWHLGAGGEAFIFMDEIIIE